MPVWILGFKMYHVIGNLKTNPKKNVLKRKNNNFLANNLLIFQIDS